MKKYRIDLTKEQLDTVQEALEFFSRFCAGQWKVPMSMEDMEYKNQDKSSEIFAKRSFVENQLEILKMQLTGLVQNASYGIGSPKLCESAKIAYDIYRPILELRDKEYKEVSPSNNDWSVYSSPGLSYSKQGRVEIKTIQENEENS